MNTRETETDKKNLLVVGDEAINREMLKAILESEYNIIFAEDGEQA